MKRASRSRRARPVVPARARLGRERSTPSVLWYNETSAADAPDVDTWGRDDPHTRSRRDDTNPAVRRSVPGIEGGHRRRRREQRSPWWRWVLVQATVAGDAPGHLRGSERYKETYWTGSRGVLRGRRRKADEDGSCCRARSTTVMNVSGQRISTTSRVGDVDHKAGRGRGLGKSDRLRPGDLLVRHHEHRPERPNCRRAANSTVSKDSAGYGVQPRVVLT